MERDGKREGRLLGGLVLYVAAYLGKMLAVEIRLLVDFHVVQVLFVNEIEQLVAEGFAGFRENVVEACRAFFCQFHRAIERFLGGNLR